VIFSGLSLSGVSDLYRMTLPDGGLEQLTNDHFQDLDPSLSPDGRRLVFASDRTAGGAEGAVNLFILDLETREIRQLTSGPWVDETPTWTPEERIYFSSDRDGVLNVFSVDTLGEGRRETSVWTGAFDAAPLPDRPGFLVSGFHDLSLGVYFLPPDSAAQQQTFALASDVPPASQWEWSVGDEASNATQSREPYKSKFTLDFAAGSATFIPRYGAAQGVTFYASDLLSDHLAYLTIASYQGKDFGSILANLNIFGLYINQTRRLNWGVGAFRSKGDTYQGDFTAVYRESAVGGLGLLQYPLSRFSRVEARMVLEHSDRVDFVIPVDQPRRVGWIASHYLTYVHDNSLWMSTGPVDGGYFGITGGLSKDFTNARFDSFLVGIDIRRYLRLSRRGAYAIRGVGFFSGGDRPDRVNIGGTLGLRGYPIYGYIVGSRAVMVNQEIRFPLFNYISLGTAGLGDLRLPDFHGAFFLDMGKATYSNDSHRAWLGSWGVSFRWPVVPGAVLRLDWGRRFSDNHFIGYGLAPDQRQRTFVQFFFGYNY
jgi:WD40 repeat protein